MTSVRNTGLAKLLLANQNVHPDDNWLFFITDTKEGATAIHTAVVCAHICGVTNYTLPWDETARSRMQVCRTVNNYRPQSWVGKVLKALDEHFPKRNGHGASKAITLGRDIILVSPTRHLAQHLLWEFLQHHGLPASYAPDAIDW